MVTPNEAVRIAVALPEVGEGTKWRYRVWSVGGNDFFWERPFSKADIKRFGAMPVPDGPIFAVRVADLDAKEIALRTWGEGFFTIEHFKGYPAVLVELRKVSRRALEAAIVDGWLACAPPALAREYARARRPTGRSRPPEPPAPGAPPPGPG